ncbi:MAG: hypothetical protein VYA34_17315 [Myxococcota bacterium]|nr:hypothetical protein [Myxococcota bacterium]
MKIRLNKIASSTRNIGLHDEVVLGETIPAVAGTVLAVRVLDTKSTYNSIEDCYGRMMPVQAGDLMAGVVGARNALRGYAGIVPKKIQKGDTLHILNTGGVIGSCTSVNPDVGPPCRVEVLGAIMRFPNLGSRVGEPANIFPGSIPLVNEVHEKLPPILWVAGTCMHAGKTSAACIFIREVTRRGLKVGAAKVTGVALRRDSLEMRDHGAVEAVTFADVGFPSTAHGNVTDIAASCINYLADREEYDLLVIELGDGIMGTYGVDKILEAPQFKRCAGALMLAANDPVGAWGAVQWFRERDWEPELITGPATDNAAGADAITKLTNVAAANARTEPDKLTDTLLASLKELL